MPLPSLRPGGSRGRLGASGGAITVDGNVDRRQRSHTSTSISPVTALLPSADHACCSHCALANAPLQAGAVVAELCAALVVGAAQAARRCTAILVDLAAGRAVVAARAEAVGVVVAAAG